ncbi:50S ribosomal protein L1 [Candidatus Kuenenbacteria bacterium RIFCSPHIGHO2_02_FULL_39_13]|uniref:Large ribosomal subunit protein uL1 n=1 Tax=Candidatus Kuenenbacteria bacterium RIFCSPHIGHO2_02_FULL_39_13 TaxID=1798561 RepID=A0A1F6FMW8_9BACT|nr:MAG: 50S ribosomal protein L1 [Candidatus Kuenenbacteria bacterium RIFCSPHIGHO2_02_FULL_39_13]
MHSKKYKEMAAKIDKAKSYSIDEAIKLVKETSQTKFDASFEVHIHLGIDTKKGEQAVRGSVALPHGTGKSKRIAVFSENEKAAKEAGADVVGNVNLIKDIKSSGKVDFDLAIATPTMMKKLAGAAKILGPKGLMPSPKAGTVVDDKAMPKAIEEIKKGKVNFKNDDTGNIHQMIGKISWDDKKLSENCGAFVEAVKKAKPAAAKGIFIKGVFLTRTMGPAVRVSN